MKTRPTKEQRLARSRRSSPPKKRVRSYTADYSRFRVLAIFPDGEIDMTLHSNQKVDFSGFIEKHGGVYPRDAMIKEAETRLRGYPAYKQTMRWDRDKLLREVYLLADSCKTFEEFVTRFITPR